MEEEVRIQNEYRTGAYLLGAECICPVCRRHFWAGDDWAYILRRTHGTDKSGDIRACSYSCLLRWQKEREEKQREEMKTRARAVFRDMGTGEKLTVKALADRLGLCQQTVRRAWNIGTVYKNRWIPEQNRG